MPLCRLIYQEFVQRYTILAPRAIPAGFVDGMKATAKLVEALAMEENEFRMGHSKVLEQSIQFSIFVVNLGVRKKHLRLSL